MGKESVPRSQVIGRLSQEEGFLKYPMRLENLSTALCMGNHPVMRLVH